MTKPAELVLSLEGDGVAARVLEDHGAGLLELQEAVRALYATGADPEPLPPDRGPPPWEPPAGPGCAACSRWAASTRYPPGTEVLELRFHAPSGPIGEGQPLVVSTVVL